MRAVSLILAVLAYFASPIWAYLQIAELPTSLKCGLPELAIVTIAALAMALLSLIALAFAVPAFLRAPRPRSWGRALELSIVALPLIVGGSYACALFGWFDA